MNNKYLEKIAASPLRRAYDFLSDVSGHEARRLKHEAETLSRAQAQGRNADQAFREAGEAKTKTNLARIKLGLGAAGVGTAGFLGLHKYHQHKDQAILDKINSMYYNQNTN